MHKRPADNEPRLDSHVNGREPAGPSSIDAKLEDIQTAANDEGAPRDHVETLERREGAKFHGGTQRPAILPRLSSVATRTAFINESSPSALDPPAGKASQEAPVTWASLPKKRQLALLTLSRLSEPLTQTSLQSYMFYQLQSFDHSLPPSTISAQVGVLQACFTAAQFLTAILWGRIADKAWAGRKRVLLVGLTGTCISCLGFGFSRSFAAAIFWRATGGALNGNVGVMRTMISEIIVEKKFQSRAFLLLPMTFNIGVIVGPVLGGLLADPVGTYPRLFGDSSHFGGEHGVWWLKHWPYALPNLLNAFFITLSALAVIFGLEETSVLRRDKPDWGLQTATSISRCFQRLTSRNRHHYAPLSHSDTVDLSSRPHSYELESRMPTTPLKSKPKRKVNIPFRKIWTPNVLTVLVAHFLLASHVGTFNTLWFTFLSTPRFDPSNPTSPARHLPFAFSGGLALPPRTIGIALAALGTMGITLQLLVYPRVNTKLGTLRSFRCFLVCFPLAYAAAPYLAIIPSSRDAPLPASGFRVWLGIVGVLAVQVVGRTFALPATAILVNNSAPHTAVLGTVHGMAQSVSSLARTLGPILGGWGFGKGLKAGVVGAVWWVLAIVAVIGWVVSWRVREGNGGYEILDNDEEGDYHAGGQEAEDSTEKGQDVLRRGSDVGPSHNHNR